ncbi:rhamnan synthesis F family protein [Undibacterium arcticum]|uniref:Rhamnan synthesis F family protein n=1 Tax=Undibacterium arcticum TaxID=1762892 RepID=A0ABV7F8B8_9BURK
MEHFELNELKQHAANLALIVDDRERRIAGLDQAIAERDGQIASLNHAVAERGGQIASLNQAIAERDGQIAGLKQATSERDGQVASLNKAELERDGQLVLLSQTVAGRDQEIAALRNSTSWRITKPLRFVSGLLRGKRDQLRVVRARGLKRAISLVKRPDMAVAQELDQLPNGFDPALYLKLNPDVADAGGDPTIHYLHHGRREGRVFSVPDLCFDHDLNVDRETVLLVSHEASRTGAPVLSLNLVHGLVGRYNVIVLLLVGGPLSDAFRLAGAAVMTSSNLRRNPVLAQLIVGQLCARFHFKFALVNSIESRVVLPALGEYFVPAISLVHEFASYIRPRGAFREALFWSGEVVFSANVTMENALAEYPDLGDRSAHILPQGRCLLPLGEFNEEQMQAERERIRRLIRPKDIAENSVIVLGAGSVELRKGVDLFIECAARVVRTPEGNRYRFVWIGKGYDPDNDIGYSVYLADQIRRAGLQEHVFFVDETNAIEVAYEEADLFLLSSRLDPLPNVAIDAMAHGVPVLCFNKTTGIADFLIESGLRNHCVAEYLDSADMAEKIVALAAQVLRESVADRCREASIAYFSMKEYIARLEVLAQGACDRTRQEKADTQVILGSGLFRRDFSPPRRQAQTIEAEVREYVRAWASGISRRKPLPGFHPGVYLEQHGLVNQGADPFADYLRAGRPAGPWDNPVIVAGDTKGTDLPANQRVALHVHVYYPDLLPEIMTRLSRNRICPDLFVSITDEKARESVVSELKNYKGQVVDIQLVPNRGRDIGPFFTAFGQRIVANYDFIGHIHTKKSADLKDATVGQSWYRFLLENLLGGESGAMADRILANMKGDTSIGMVFPDDPHVVGWSDNRAFADILAVRMGLENLPDNFVFPVGTMFWATSSALLPLMNLKLDWDDYPDEPLPYDGSSLHAIERLFSLSLSANNLRSVTTNVIGLTR